jgi:hypothetical protein
LLRLLEQELDAGEAEALALAIERQADLMLVDEVEARRVAELYGIAKTGVIGLLIRAKQENIVPSLRAELDRLRSVGAFWIADGLFEKALAAVGERR